MQGLGNPAFGAEAGIVHGLAKNPQARWVSARWRAFYSANGLGNVSGIDQPDVCACLYTEACSTSRLAVVHIGCDGYILGGKQGPHDGSPGIPTLSASA